MSLTESTNKGFNVTYISRKKEFNVTYRISN